jgi:hypothetical protein
MNESKVHWTGYYAVSRPHLECILEQSRQTHNSRRRSGAISFFLHVYTIDSSRAGS